MIFQYVYVRWQLGRVIRHSSPTLHANILTELYHALVLTFVSRPFGIELMESAGYHPWFSHLISLESVTDTPEAKDNHYRSLFLSSNPSETHLQAFSHLLPSLPHPSPLSAIISEIRSNIVTFLDLHRASPTTLSKPMLGEVGLDRSFRIPFVAYDPSLPTPPEASSDPARPRLTPFHVPIEHQLAILKAQLAVAVELRVNVSLHSVKVQQATGALFDEMKKTYGDKWHAISVDMHSCGVSAETWCDIEVRHYHLFRT